MNIPRSLPNVIPESIKDPRNANPDDAMRALSMLRLVTNTRLSPDILPGQAGERLENYSSGMRMGRDGGFTVFRPENSSSIAAMTHVTHVGTHYLELDALARHPDAYGQRMGTAALAYTITQSERTIGLWTPERNIDFYEQHGFHVDTEVSELSRNNAFFRMERHPDEPAL